MIANHLSRLQNTTKEEKEIEIVENFPDEQLFVLLVQVPWYANIVNYFACGVMLPEFSHQQKRELRIDNRFYI